ncbi:MAG: replication-associated recombination protein A [Actinomycetota bacterium]
MPEDLFSHQLEERFDEFAPLAARVRPRTLEEFVGQEHIVGPDGPLRALIESDRLSSMILWGPAGTGKTSLAGIVASVTGSRFVPTSAVASTVADLRREIAAAKESLGATGRKTILFIDEVHRFNKSQQDALLPAVENGYVTLIGATTENPFFEINSPLISRSLLFRLEVLGREEVRKIVERAIEDPKGLDGSIKVDEQALDHILDRAGGDARWALNALEMCASAASSAGEEIVDAAAAAKALQQTVVRYDRAGDRHYDVISAFIKSMRGSDPDAALWWLARMIEGGEDPRFIARRMVIFASEDVGNADPTALVVAVSAFQALEFVGLPEAALNLAQAATYLSTAEKSNASTVGLSRAMGDVKAGLSDEVPMHLRDSSYRSAAKIGHGKGYRYPHAFEDAWVEQAYRPPEVAERIYYEPTSRGIEREIGARMARRRRQPDEDNDSS